MKEGKEDQKNKGLDVVKQEVPASHMNFGLDQAVAVADEDEKFIPSKLCHMLF